MTAIAQHYATQFRIARIQPYINYSDYYRSMAEQLCVVAEHYSEKKTETIFMNYVEVVRSLEKLADLCHTTTYKPGDLVSAKQVLYKAFTNLIAHLEMHNTYFPDKNLERDIANGKALAEEFRV